MSIKFSDGSSIEASDWYRMMSIIKEQAKEEGSAVPTQITQGGVTIDLRGLEVNKDAKVKHAKGQEYSKYIESPYKGWKIRVWRMSKEGVYGVNYFKSEDVRYMEVPFDDVKDENGVFKYVQGYIDEIDD